MDGGFRRNSDSELKLKNRCTGSTHKLKRSYATNPVLWLKTRMRSSKMRTDRLLTASRRIPCISVGGGGFCIQDGLLPGGSASGGSASWRGLHPRSAYRGDWADTPVDRQTTVKTLSCPKLRLRAVMNARTYI